MLYFMGLQQTKELYEEWRDETCEIPRRNVKRKIGALDQVHMLSFVGWKRILSRRLFLIYKLY